METLIMKGKPVADAYRATISAKIAAAAERGQKVTLAIVVVGSDPASHIYKDRLAKLAQSLGADVKLVLLPEESTQEEIIAAIKKMNRNRYITGVLPMLPMPRHINGEEAAAFISASKDIDCLNYANAGEFYSGRSPWGPCTPRACMAALDYYGIELAGKNVVVIGRSNVVGKPVALMLLARHATVTVCHSRTKNLAQLVRAADIVISAVGKADFVTAEMVKEGAVLIDVGINELDGKIVGDISAEACAKASAYTPVPGGIGVISNMMVMDCLTRGL